MKNRFIILCLLFSTLSFYQCSNEPANEIPNKNVIIEHHYPEDITTLGQTFARAINEVATKKALGNYNTKKIAIVNKERLEEKMMKSLNKSGLENFSKEQLNILRLLAVTRKSSRSYTEFSNRLNQINERIYLTVPEPEQKKLLQITGMLYYGLKEINELAKKGIVSGKPEGVENSLTLSRIKLGLELAHAQSENIDDYDNESWWNDNSWLSGVWAVALVEPTPVGEAVAIIVSIGVASYYILTRADCIDEYEDCIQYSANPRDCYACFRYCTAQGVWNCN